MSDEHHPGSPTQPDAHRERRADDVALARSSPDELTVFRELVGDFLAAGGTRGREWLSVITTVFSGITLWIMTVARFGTTSLLALSTLITAMMAYKADERTADRQAEIEKMKVAAEIDRANGLEIEGRLAQIVSVVEGTNLTVRAIGEEVTELDNRISKIEDAHRRPR